MIIIGAGMSGLLAGALNPGSTIYEAGPERESDHQALFRCKSDSIGKMLGIPFKEVEICKSIWLDGEEVQPSPRIAHLYSKKVSGKITGRSILDIKPGKRFIPPCDFVEQLKSRCKINYDQKISMSDIAHITPQISTIPMPSIAKMLGFEMPECKSDPIYVNKLKLKNCDSYCTVYYPSDKLDIYRASITKDILTIESTSPLVSASDLYEICKSLGINQNDTEDFVMQNKIQKFGKITGIDNQIRKKFITKLTLNYNIYSLGRFATWRPKVMLDDVLEDIFVIRRLIEGGKYSSINHKQNDKG